MTADYGHKVAEFHTKLSDLLLMRFFSWNVLISLALAGVITYVALTTDNSGAPLWRLLLAGGLLIVLPMLFVLFSLFLRPYYRAEIFAQGLILTKGSRTINISFDEIAGLRDILWEHGSFFLFSLFRTRELEIHLQGQRRVISIDGKKIVNIKGFSASLVDAFDQYKGKEDASIADRTP